MPAVFETASGQARFKLGLLCRSRCGTRPRGVRCKECLSVASGVLGRTTTSTKEAPLSDTERSGRLQNTYDTNIATDATSSREVAEIYDNWAEDYERRILSYGYSTPAVTAWFFGRYVRPEDGAVLDAGAGTGIMGPILAPLGYRDLIGIDISPRMLELAREKGVYSDLRQMELGGELDFPTDAFAAVVSTGVFAAGHAP